MLGFIDNKIPVIIIMSVIGLAFFAGYLQNNYATQSDDARKQASEHQLLTQLIDEKKRYESSFEVAF